MKLSFSLALLAAAAISVQAAATPVKASSTCISGSSGKSNGDGYYGYCCKTSDDCQESCKSGVCNGPSWSSRTTSTSLPTQTVGPCVAGVKGKRNGDGYLGYCCSSSDDCVKNCKSGVCDGPSWSSRTTSTSLPTQTVGPCVAGVKGKRNGDGYLGYCCSSSDDCVNSCKSGVCNGQSKPNDPPAGSACYAGYAGLKNGQGPSAACCWDSDDCQESCVNGRCS